MLNSPQKAKSAVRIHVTELGSKILANNSTKRRIKGENLIVLKAKISTLRFFSTMLSKPVNRWQPKYLIIFFLEKRFGYIVWHAKTASNKVNGKCR